MEQHIKTLGILWIVWGVIGILLGLLVFGLVAGAGAISGDETAMFVTGTVGIAIAAFFLILSVPAIIVGIGLQKHHGWARILAIVLAVLNVLSFPFGTALAVYTFWVLLNDRTTPLFAT